MRVPFADLLAQYRTIQPEIDMAIREVIEKSAFIGGQFVKEFEDAYAKAYGVKHCVSVANGTDAISIVLRMLGLGPGDEVITTAMSWISTAEAIGGTGAVPVFVDVDEHYNLDPSKLEEAITPRTKAVLPVHLYGQPAQMDAIRDICERHRLLLVEDCAQAHFASYNNRYVGTFGIAGTFSFYPGKNLGAYGDAGAIVTNDDDLARRCRMYANHGALKKHEHEIEGINSRLDGLQAAILTRKLSHLANWTRRRQEVAAQYRQLLARTEGVILPVSAPRATHVYHLFVVRVANREALRQRLTERGIETGIHYPTALPFLRVYEARGHKPHEFPAAFRNQSSILSLPIFPEMAREQVQYVADEIRSFVS